MAEILTSAQMRAREQAAIESGAVTGLQLMERAGVGVVAAIEARFAALRHAIVLCGPGNNGGDGFVVARVLQERGWRVSLCLLGHLDRLPPDARVHARLWEERGSIQPYETDTLLAAAAGAKRDGAVSWVVVDALFGIGQRAPMDQALAPLNALIDATFGAGVGPAPVFVSVDIPTGLDADTGMALARRPAPSDMVVTFHRPKPVHVMPHMADPELVIVDIGLR